MKKRGQVTVFVVLGIVILFAAALIMYASQMAAELDFQRQIDDSIQDFLELNSINHFVGTCLDKVTTDGVMLLGEQGGVLYESQNGTWPDPEPPYIGVRHLPYTYNIPTYSGEPEIRTANVYYVLQENVQCALFQPPQPIDLSEEETSYYPIRDEYIANYNAHYGGYAFSGAGCIPLGYNYIRQSGFLGANRLLPLCSYNGSNLGGDASHCLPSQYDTPLNPYSFQRQLENYVQKELPHCANFTVLLQTGSLVVPKPENVSVDIQLLHPRGIRAQATYPFEVHIEGRQPVIQMVDFHADLDSNIRNLYTYLQELLVKTVRDPYFNITRDWNNRSRVRSYQPTFFLTFHEQVCTDCESADAQVDDLYSITDTSTVLKGRTFTYNFASKQRRPALDFIHDAAYDYRIDLGPYSIEFDKQFFSNATMILAPNAVDPNGDDLTYEYRGWLQNYSETIDWECCEQPDRDCSLLGYRECLVREEPYEGETWMESAMFQATQQNASLLANRSHIGFHNVTIIVTDEHGERDFQIVKLLIFDLPLAVLNVTNHFDDVYDGIASIEDAYTLDGSESIISAFVGGEFSRAEFIDDLEGFYHNINIESDGVDFDGDGTLDLPLTLHLPDMSLHGQIPEDLTLISDIHIQENIVQGNFSRAKLGGQNQVEHTISLIVYQDPGTGVILPSPPATAQVTVAQCLPHGYIQPEGTTNFEPLTHYGENPVAFPYEGAEFFSAPHVCCQPETIPTDPTNLSGGTFYAGTAPCYQTEFYMAYLDDTVAYPHLREAYTDNATGNLFPVVTPTTADYEEYYPDIELPYERENDPYEIIYTQQCSGNRGNVCSGFIDVDGDTALRCNDLLVGISWQFARCQGPGYRDINGVERLAPYQASYVFPEGAEPICYNFEAGATSYFSFEDYVGGLSEHYLGGDVERKEDLIQQGYCGEAQAMTAVEDASTLTTIGDTTFDCYPECDGEGWCSYPTESYSATSCTCNRGGLCSDFSLASFYIGEEFRLRCGVSDANIHYACDLDCVPRLTTTTDNFNARRACACAINHPQTWADPELPPQYEYFFDAATGTNLVRTDSTFGLCCAGSNDIYEATSQLSAVNPSYDKQVCWNGNVMVDGKIIDIDQTLLSCDGKIVHCDTTSDCSNGGVSSGYAEACAGRNDELQNCGSRHLRCTATGWRPVY